MTAEPPHGEGPAREPAATCPYCHVVLPRRPQRKARCKACGQSILVKSLPNTRERELVTEEGARAIDEQWIAHYQSRAFEHWLERFQLDVAVFRERRAAKQDLGDRDIIWGMFNESVRDLITQGDFQALKTRYYGMALFVAEEDRGFVDLLAASRQMELRAYQETGLVKEVEISAAGKGNACSACQGLDGKVFTIEEALRTMPLPCKECTMVVVGTKPGFCRCTYLPVLR